MKLYFSGHGWLTAHLVEDANPLQTKPLSAVDAAPPVNHFAAGSRIKLRSWVAEQPLAIWRNFAEIDSVDAALRFIRRHGEPTGREIDRTVSETDWQDLKGTLSLAAQLWSEEVDEDGASAFVDIPVPTLIPKLNGLLNSFVREESVAIVDPNGGGLAIRARTLGAFLAASAAEHIKNRSSMRRCPSCTDWFTPQRRTARYCSDTCRSAASLRRTAVQV